VVQKRSDCSLVERNSGLDSAAAHHPQLKRLLPIFRLWGATSFAFDKSIESNRVIN
jgi:hypothetical protein